MNLMFNMENRLSEVLMRELNESYTIVFNRLSPSPDDSNMIVLINVNEPKDKNGNRWFPKN